MSLHGGGGGRGSIGPVTHINATFHLTSIHI